LIFLVNYKVFLTVCLILT